MWVEELGLGRTLFPKNVIDLGLGLELGLGLGLELGLGLRLGLELRLGLGYG